MTREIEFKTYHKKTLVPEYITLQDAINGAGFDVKFDDYHFCQFTGLKDKNGKEIYEGDIVLSHKEYNSYSGLNSTIYAGNKYQIKNNGWRFYLAPSGLYQVDMEEIEIIGNIYENPELVNE